MIKQFELVHQYVDGWKENNIHKILQPLADDCIIIESHGPTYHGKLQVISWFNFWIEKGGKVITWDITSLYFCDSQNIAFAEWYFLCIVQKKEYHLPGISKVTFSDETISSIHEYRMTHIPYLWLGKHLNPD